MKKEELTEKKWEDKESTNLFEQGYEPTNWEILSKFTSLSAVNVTNCVLKTMKPYSAVMIIGHFEDPSKLAAAGIGNSIMIIGLLSILGGVNRPLDTLNTQAYGDGNLKLCGSYLNKGRII